MNRIWPNIAILAIMSGIWGCVRPTGSSTDSDSTTATTGDATLFFTQNGNSAPDSVLTEQIYHFWDTLNIANSNTRSDTLYIEQKFITYSRLLESIHTDRSNFEYLSAPFVKKASTDSTILSLLLEIIEKNLWDSNSPIRNESHYLWLTKAILDNTDAHVDQSWRIRMEMIGDIAAKNEAGTLAADFEYIDLNGHKSTLKQTASQYRQLILLFYDPECNSCHDIIKRTADSPLLNRAITTKNVGVLAVYTGNDIDTWQHDAATMPSNWIVAIDSESKIEDEGKYNLPSMPVIYILDSKSRVIIKNADISTIL